MRQWGPTVLSLTLLVLTVITVTRGQTQDFDILQGLQRRFQPYLGNENINVFNGATSAPHKQTNRQERKKKTIIRHRTEERLTKQPPPMYQYDYVFATTENPSRKTTKSISNQNNNSSTFNNMNEQSNIFFGEYPYEIPTRGNRVKTTTTTEASYFNYDGNRGTTQNVFSNNSNVARPVTENVNHKETFAVNNQTTAADNNNFGNTGVGFNNTGNTNNNNTRGNSNNNTNNSNSDSTNNSNNNSTNNLNQGNNFGGFNYSDTPMINPPEVQTSPVDAGVPPITNRPASINNNFGDFNRPSGPSSGTSTDKPIQETEILIGPNEDDMTESQKKQYAEKAERKTSTDQPDQDPEILIGPNEDDMTESQKKEYAEKAERMCDYYKSFAVKKALSRRLSPDPGEKKVSDCAPINVPLVIGGSVTSIREFPHMALVGWKEVKRTGYGWFCGGSLISDRYVLTAGHCTRSNDRDVVSAYPRAVQLGSSYRDDREALVVKISAVIRHPKYKPPSKYHDVALIKMVSKVMFSEVIRPACLGVPPPTGRSITATGWGSTVDGGDLSVQLRSVSLNVWDMQEYQDIIGNSRTFRDGVLPDSHLCAGDRTGWHDTCGGDGGGPVQIQDGCLWRVVAVTSFGRGCGSPDFPSVYAVIPHAFVAAQVFDEVSLQ